MSAATRLSSTSVLLRRRPLSGSRQRPTSICVQAGHSRAHGHGSRGKRRGSCRPAASLGHEGGLTILQQYLKTVRKIVRPPRAFVRVDSSPGDRFEIDWCHFGTLEYQEDKRKLYAFSCDEHHNDVQTSRRRSIRIPARHSSTHQHTSSEQPGGFAARQVEDGTGGSRSLIHALSQQNHSSRENRVMGSPDAYKSSAVSLSSTLSVQFKCAHCAHPSPLLGSATSEGHRWKMDS